MGSTTTSYFGSLPDVKSDEVFGLMAAFHSDKNPNRVNLAPGVYCSDDGKSWPLEVVGRVERSIHEQQDIGRHDYLPIEGDHRFLSAARNLIFSSTISSSPELQQATQSRIVSVQTISGTGANHIGARFLAENLRPRCVWLSYPTWANHHTIWDSLGVVQRTYPYYNASDCTFDFTAMMAVLESESQPRDVVVLHACAHNPTGLDPSQEEWKAIAELCQRKQLFPFFDNAYQGFASGNPVQDAWAIRYFYHLQPTLEMCVAQSFSKNFGLYGQRVGAFHLVMTDNLQSAQDKVLRNLSQLIRAEYSVAPRYGSIIVKTILEDETLSKEWEADLQIISGRIRSMRLALYKELCCLCTPGSWQHIKEQVCHCRHAV